MTVKRRSFIKSALAASAVPYMRTFAAQAKPFLRMGILSDTHVRSPGPTLDPFVGALKWFDAQKVDGVVIAGDIVDQGLTEQLRHVGAAWDSVFPGGKASDGRAVEKVFVTGNHDNHFWKHASAKKLYPDEKERYDRSIAKDFNAAWTECFHEEFIRLYRKDIKGYPFLGFQYGSKGLGGFIEKERATLDPSKPFFYVQHQHLKDTCYGPWAWGQDGGESTAALSKCPNAVAFSGHSHYPLTDERSVWQGAFTSIGTASLSYIAAPDCTFYENARDDEKRVKEMPVFAARNGKHGMLMEVFADRIVLSRKNMLPGTVEPLGPDWTIPLPFAEPPPFAFASRAAKVSVPEFPANSRVAVKEHDGANRDRVKHRQVAVEFPAATAGGRVYDYEVRAEASGDDGKALVRRIVSPTFHLPRNRDKGKARCVFSAAELPAKCSFSVYPRNSFGVCGKPVKSGVWERKTV